MAWFGGRGYKRKFSLLLHLYVALSFSLQVYAKSQCLGQARWTGSICEANGESAAKCAEKSTLCTWDQGPSGVHYCAAVHCTDLKTKDLCNQLLGCGWFVDTTNQEGFGDVVDTNTNETAGDVVTEGGLKTLKLVKRKDIFNYTDLIWGLTMGVLGFIVVLGLVRVCYTIYTLVNVPLEDIAPITPLPAWVIALDMVGSLFALVTSCMCMVGWMLGGSFLGIDREMLGMVHLNEVAIACGILGATSEMSLNVTYIFYEKRFLLRITDPKSKRVFGRSMVIFRYLSSILLAVAGFLTLHSHSNGLQVYEVRDEKVMWVTTSELAIDIDDVHVWQRACMMTGRPSSQCALQAPKVWYLNMGAQLLAMLCALLAVYMQGKCMIGNGPRVVVYSFADPEPAAFQTEMGGLRPAISTSKLKKSLSTRFSDGINPGYPLIICGNNEILGDDDYLMSNDSSMILQSLGGGGKLKEAVTFDGYDYVLTDAGPGSQPPPEYSGGRRVLFAPPDTTENRLSTATEVTLDDDFASENAMMRISLQKSHSAGSDSSVATSHGNNVSETDLFPPMGRRTGSDAALIRKQTFGAPSTKQLGRANTGPVQSKKSVHGPRLTSANSASRLVPNGATVHAQPSKAALDPVRQSYERMAQLQYQLHKQQRQLARMQSNETARQLSHKSSRESQGSDYSAPEYQMMARSNSNNSGAHAGLSHMHTVQTGGTNSRKSSLQSQPSLGSVPSTRESSLQSHPSSSLPTRKASTTSYEFQGSKTSHGATTSSMALFSDQQRYTRHPLETDDDGRFGYDEASSPGPDHTPSTDIQMYRLAAALTRLSSQTNTGAEGGGRGQSAIVDGGDYCRDRQRHVAGGSSKYDGVDRKYQTDGSGITVAHC